MKVLTNKRAGISLVALIVTIIVLIILTAAVIVTFMEGGIIDRAKKAVFRSDIRNYQDILLEKSSVRKIDRETGTGLEEYAEITKQGKDEIKTVIPEFKDEYDGVVDIENGKLVLGANVLPEHPEGKYARYKEWLLELGIEAPTGSNNGGALAENAIANKVAVGDYVNYNAKISGDKNYTIDAGDTSWIYNKKDNNNTYDSGEETIARQHINWVVLSKNDTTGEVTLISETPIDKIYMYGAKGYTEGPDKLDEISGDLYGSSIGSARNLRVEDVNAITGYEASTARYWISNHEEQTTGYETVISTLGTISGNGPDGETPVGNYGLTYYGYQGSTYKTAENTTAYNLVFGASNNYIYWLSSSCVYARFSNDYAEFCVRHVYEGYVDAYDLYHSGGVEDGDGYSFRPVVVLSSNVQVVESAGTHTTSGTAWEIE